MTPLCLFYKKSTRINMEFRHIVTFTIFCLILTPFLSVVNATELASPHKQMGFGVSAENVKCTSGFVLMVRSTNGLAACVKPSTSEILSNAGWGTIIQTIHGQISNEDPKEGTTSEQPKSPEEGYSNTIEIKIKDGIGTTENP